MIQLMSARQQSAAMLDSGGQLVLSRQPAAQDGLPGFSSQTPTTEELAGFVEQLAATLARTEEQPLPSLPELPVPAAVEAQLAGENATGQQPEGGSQQPLAAEQWLLGMQGQQQAVIEARTGDQPAEPLVERAGAGGASAPQSGAILPSAELPAEAPAAQGYGLNRSGELATSGAGPLPDRTAAGSTSGSLAAMPAAEPPQTTLSGGSETPQSGQVERLLAATAQAAPSESAAPTAADSTQNAQPRPIERTIKLEAPEAKWGEQMLHALRKNVELQLQQRVQSANIRLDPPELGSLEIFLSHESGRLSVQISAANGDVARLLQQTSERLRQELVEQNYLQVSVEVAADGQQGQQEDGQQRPRFAVADRLPAASESRDRGHAQSRSSGRDSDVLVTV